LNGIFFCSASAIHREKSSAGRGLQRSIADAHQVGNLQGPKPRSRLVTKPWASTVSTDKAIERAACKRRRLPLRPLRGGCFESDGD
jgi:hypothetical protein